MNIVAFCIFLIFDVSNHVKADQGISVGKYNLSINQTTQRPEIKELKANYQFNYKVLKLADVDNYEQFLDFLYELNRELFQQPVVIHASGSLQPSSLGNPRILLYSKNLVLAFSTQEKKTKTVEVMEFDDQKLNFNFHEIIFEDNKKPIFVDNAPKCTTCHGAPARPIWEAYDFWPTAMGSFSGIPLSKSESAFIKTFKDLKGSQKLISRIRGADFKSAIDTFTGYLSQMNFLVGLKSIESQLRQEELYRYRFYFLGMMSCVNHGYLPDLNKNLIYKDFLPENFAEKMTISFDQIFNDVLASNQSVKKQLFDIYLNTFSDGAPLVGQGLGLDRLSNIEITVSSQLEFILANYGLSLRDMILSMRKDNYILSTPNIFELDLQKTFVFVFPELLNELSYKLKFDFLEGGYYEFNCDELKQKSISEIEKIEKKNEFPFVSALSSNKHESSFGKCIHCHSSSTRDLKVPYLPFENTKKLGVLLNNGLLEKTVDRLTRKDSLMMPAGLSHLSEKEVKNFVDVLQDIKKMTSQD